MVLISREDRSAVYNYLLKEGVIVVKKDARLVSHQELRGIPNIRVMMILKSLKSNSLVEETFSWQWYYYALTEKGIKSMRELVGAEATAVPATHSKRAGERKKIVGEEGEERTRRYGGPGRRGGFGRGRRGDREGEEQTEKPAEETAPAAAEETS
jgi:small subunit ribosomal protein S10e